MTIALLKSTDTLENNDTLQNDTHIVHNPQNLLLCYLRDKRGFTDMIKVKIVR